MLTSFIVFFLSYVALC